MSGYQINGAKLRAYRAQCGWSQLTLAIKAGVAASTVVRLEGGTARAHRATVRALARALELTNPYDLLDEKAEIAPDD